MFLKSTKPSNEWFNKSAVKFFIRAPQKWLKVRGGKKRKRKRGEGEKAGWGKNIEKGSDPYSE